MPEILKKHNTVGCCGIDCGLCPRFHAGGISACPGCGGMNFRDKHPSCGFLTCCTIKRGMEVCSDCTDYPCSRFDSERKGFDSFVTHKKVFVNLDLIKAYGIGYFINQQKSRMNILEYFLDNYDDGRSKSYFCLVCALLPVDSLQEAQRSMIDNGYALTLKEKNIRLKEILQIIAENLKIDLKLNNKT